MTKSKLLPQANNLETVIRVFLFISVMDNYTLDDIADFCQFEPRQASYYLNACIYLDLVDINGHITSLGRSILTKNETPHKSIYERIVTDPIIGKVFAHRLFFPDDDIRAFTVDLLVKLYPEYGDAVILRRASTLKSWCDDIIRTFR